MCSEPFDVSPHIHTRNQEREDYLDPRRRKDDRLRLQDPPCHPELRWPSVKEHWQQVKSDSFDEIASIILGANVVRTGGFIGADVELSCLESGSETGVSNLENDRHTVV